ncbi:MAG: type II toxin-antitoxin system VapC family toxin [Pseudomonadota bacterium]
MPTDKKSVYVETSIISYLTARPSRDLLAAAWQKVTVDWWETQRPRFDLFVSDVVIEEAGRGDETAVVRRLEALAGIPILEINEEVVAFSEALIEARALPQKAIGDALHIALSVVHGIDYLLTWNCRHIDNAETKPLIRGVCLANRYGYPEICTPRELMGVYENA